MSKLDALQANQLDSAPSPYLHQHKHNPVHWQQWSDQSIAAARALNKPILLSIGYSACHWCHVMAHESFEDPATARVMNEHFVNIKVDREERPDLDKIYQLAHQLLNQRAGGWPLTAFLHPDDLTPFFSGTYFPKEPRYGMPAFTQLLTQLSGFFRAKTDDVLRQGEQIRKALAQIQTSQSSRLPGPELFDRFTQELNELSDQEYGGLGGGPKFPQPSIWQAVLALVSKDPANESTRSTSELALCNTLDAMSSGGLYDHLGGGFFRYCVDGKWQIPHFEKMLYDNAQLISLFTQAASLYKNGAYAQVAQQSIDCMIAEFSEPSGGFYSAFDADSEGEEGRYYVWEREQIEAVLEPDQCRVFEGYYGLDLEPNFEGRYHLQQHQALEATANQAELTPKLAQIQLFAATSQLLELRRQREKPFRDEKVLTSWNALMLRALAMAANQFNRPDYLQRAEQLNDFLRQTMWKDGELFACWKAGKAYQSGFLDDYAFWAEALIELLQTRWDDRDYQLLELLLDSMVEKFSDADNGGFFFSESDTEHLITRSRSFADEALPSANGVLARILPAAAALLARPQFDEIAHRSLVAGADLMGQAPVSAAGLVQALEGYLEGNQVVLIRGPASLIGSWRDPLQKDWQPSRYVFAIPDNTAVNGLNQRYPRSVDESEQRQSESSGEVCAYLCERGTCSTPINDLNQLLKRLTSA